MRGIIALLIAATAILPTGNVSAPDTGWYIGKTKNGTLPVPDSCFSELFSHGVYYADKRAADAGDRVIYLTFDAGYENGNVAKVLDTLRDEGVPGAFFVLKHLVKDETPIVRRMVDEGHLVCNHTARHPDMTKLGETAFRREIGDMEDIYRDAIGGEIAKFYRPPEGRINEENAVLAEKLGYKTVLWSFAYADWDNGKQPDAKTAKEKILAGTHPGMIILLHPTSATNAAILGDLIRAWKEEGYRFGTLNEL